MNIDWKWFMLGAAIGWFVLPRVQSALMSRVTK